jgi:signal transduction histidine kinase
MSERPPVAGSSTLRVTRAWPFVPLAPLIVVLVGLAVASALAALGFRDLGAASDEQAAGRAGLLASVLAARLSKIPPEGRADALRLAATRTGAEYLLVSAPPGAPPRVVADASLGLPDEHDAGRVLREDRGEAVTRVGRTAFAAERVPDEDDARVVAFVRKPSSPPGWPALLTALVALTTLLIGTAGTVAFLVARDAEHDVAFVTRRVRAMADVRVEPSGEPVPVRTMDEVGALTSAFNDLQGRFAEAERAYRRSLDKARAQDKERAAFLAAVSHELRSPLNAILGFTDVLLAEVDGPLGPQAREEIEQIRESGEHLSALIADILEFSAIDSGQIQIHPERVELHRVAQEVLREAQPQLAAKPVALHLRGDPTVAAWADAKRVRQIVGNIVGNAVKFTYEGSITVVVERRGDEALVAVTDTGPGIGAAERQAIFEVYGQGESERTRRRGVGLGLAIARRLAALQRGRIELETELGKGSTFTVFLPAWSPPADRPRGVRL